MKFKKGDVVRCVNAGMVRSSSPQGNEVIFGNRYQVMAHSEKDNVKIINERSRQQGYYPERFVLDETCKITQILSHYDS